MTQILLQTLEVAWALAMRQVLRDGVGGMLQGLEPVHMPGHEVPDAMTALALESRHHVHQNEFGYDVRAGLMRGLDSGHSAHAGSDEYDRPSNVFQHGCRIARERIDGVLGVGRAVTIAMPAGIECDDMKAMVGENLAGVLPRESVLPTTVQHQDRRPVGIDGAAVPFIGDQL